MQKVRFWDPEHWRFRAEESQPQVLSLNQVGTKAGASWSNVQTNGTANSIKMEPTSHPIDWLRQS